MRAVLREIWVWLVLLAMWGAVVPGGAWLSYVLRYGGCETGPCHSSAMGYATLLGFIALPWGIILILILIATLLAARDARPISRE